MTRISTRAALVMAALTLATPVLAQPSSPTIELTLADAVQRAMEHNPDLAVVSLDTGIGAARVSESRGAYAPMFTTTLGRSRNVTPPTNYLLGDVGVDVKDWFSTTAVRQRLPWGAGTWSVSWDAARTTTNSPLNSVDPNLQSGIQFAFSQPLLRDRKLDAAREQVIVATRNRDSSELQVQEAAVQTAAAVKQAYWTLKATLANVDVGQRSLDVALQLARENRIRVEAGQSPPLDMVQAEAEVADRRENLIRARASTGDAEDRLRRLIMDPADPSFWQVRIDPVDEPPSPDAAPDVEAAVRRALAGRYDLARAAHDLANTATTVDLLDNQRLPDVRLETSYRGSGLGGTDVLRTGTFPGTVIGTHDRSFANALGQAFSPDYPTWSVGVTVSYPLGRSYEEASLARATIERQQAGQRIASLRLDVATAVRQAGRQVQSSAERIDAARAASTLAEERALDEQRRFDVGLSTTFLVTQAQRDLLQAQVALLQTMLDHQSAVVTFEAIQQAPAAGSGDRSAAGGADVVLLPTPSPRGIFRTGSD